MENFKLFSYGFIHFDNEQQKEEFYRNVEGARFLIEKQKGVCVQFKPVKRKDPQYLRNEHRVRNLIIF